MPTIFRVHEARGLDVNPRTILKFKNAQDEASVEKLIQIHADEITHVASGQKWFSWICSITRKDRYKTFHNIVSEFFRGYKLLVKLKLKR